MGACMATTWLQESRFDLRPLYLENRNDSSPLGLLAVAPWAPLEEVQVPACHEQERSLVKACVL